MFFCPNCGNINTSDIILVDERIPKMSNGDKIVSPRCRLCDERLIPDNTWKSENEKQKVVMITGLCGAGKSSIGQMLERKTGYIHIDGDAVSKRVNWDIRNGCQKKRSGYLVYDELLETIQVLLQQGYSVIGTYVLSEEEMKKYEAKFTEIGVSNYFFVLKTDKDICIQRDKERTCWTAGEEFVMKWYDEQRALAESNRWTVVENSTDSLNDTVQKILLNFTEKEI